MSIVEGIIIVLLLANLWLSYRAYYWAKNADTWGELNCASIHKYGMDQ